MFAEAWLGLDRFQGDPASARDVGAWLRGIARNRARMARRPRAVPLEHALVEQEPADEPRAEYPLAEAVRAEVGHLPEREREAVLATYFDVERARRRGTAGRRSAPNEGLLRRARARLGGAAAALRC